MSLELSQPEFRTIALLNVVLVILAISFILHYLVVSRRLVPEAVTVQKIDTMIDFDGAYGTATPIEDEDEEEDYEEEMTE
jgi:hypothetical protein